MGQLYSPDGRPKSSTTNGKECATSGSVEAYTEESSSMLSTAETSVNTAGLDGWSPGQHGLVGQAHQQWIYCQPAEHSIWVSSDSEISTAQAQI